MPRAWTVFTTILVGGGFGVLMWYGLLSVLDELNTQAYAFGSPIGTIIGLMFYGISITALVVMLFPPLVTTIRFYSIVKMLRRLMDRQGNDGYVRQFSRRYVHSKRTDKVPFTVRQLEDKSFVVRIPQYKTFWTLDDGAKFYYEFTIRYLNDDFSAYFSKLKTVKLGLDEMLDTDSYGVFWSKYRANSDYLRSESKRIDKKEIKILYYFLRAV